MQELLRAGAQTVLIRAFKMSSQVKFLKDSHIAIRVSQKQLSPDFGSNFETAQPMIGLKLSTLAVIALKRQN